MKSILSDLRPRFAGFPAISPNAHAKDSFHRRKLHFPACCHKEDDRRRESVPDGSPPSGAESSGSSRRGEILALLRRIQLSVSEKEKGKETNSDKSQRIKSAVKSQRGKSSAKKQARVGRTSNQSGNQKLSDSEEIYKLESSQMSEDLSQQVDSRPLRSPSSFFRRSPIPAPSPPRGRSMSIQLTKEEPTEKNPLVGTLDGLKLSDLKSLARSRGIRGYSKLNKTQLVELLNIQANPA